MRNVAKVSTSAIVGLDALPVEVEVFLKEGQPRFTIIGLGDNAVRESRDRTMSAIRQSGFGTPDQILVNLAPAELKKEGSSFDLPIAVAILLGSGQIKPSFRRRMHYLGELALDGKLKPVRGVIALTIQALVSGADEIVVPRANLPEARLITGLQVTGVGSLAELVAYLEGGELDPAPVEESPPLPPIRSGASFSEVYGQQTAKRAMLIAAAGGHNLLMIGPPGCGKSMLAQRFPSILPPLEREEILETVRIHSIAGLPISRLLEGERPFRSPHHIISDAGLVGGGTQPRPGEISLAHRGVLFLDELPEYRRSAIEALRAPLESGTVSVARARWSLSFPARFVLVAAMNPCPCGRLGSDGSGCKCSRPAVQSYLRKLSQPILDRIDLQVSLHPVSGADMLGGLRETRSMTDGELREKVALARRLQTEAGGEVNASCDPEEVRRRARLSPSALKLLEKAASAAAMSARGYFRVLKVALTIAALDGRAGVKEEDLAEAFSFRSLDWLKRYTAPDGLGDAAGASQS